ncbi:MAG: NAD-dependent succinate-semialdehyde dehydrogenase [Propionibacteriaceae bacterium]|jgi:succinate-semialdehyde dehydrogenase/glutarate-semialdehyde dehydrogenase|nr:NAD-dependent succinate-semialdehyde dehydrogenase [Propionibacteriaceae bacterium]
MTDTSADVAAALALAPTDLFIDGQWRPASDSARLDVVDPATETVIASVADATAADAEAAIDAAARAQADWSTTAPRARSEILRRAFDLVIAHREELATLITLEMGKPLADARGEVTYGAEFLRWFSEEAVRINGRTTLTPEGNLQVLTAKRPVGPCYFVTPWNFPLAMATRKIAPALAAGCTCVLKAAQLTPLTALAFVALLDQAGVPAGVVNIVTASSASRISAPILRDRRLRKLSFTGSTAVGQRLLKDAADGVLRTSMELGGCAPFIVFADADLDRALDAAVATKLRSNGEACNAANTFYVEAPVAAAFARGLAERFAAVRLGPGLDDGVSLGALASAEQRDAVAELVDDAVARGATVLTGGTAPDGPGFFYPATVLADVPGDARIATEEIFGPVAPVVTFTSEDEVVERCQASDFGLQGYLHTADSARVTRLARLLEVGMLSVNTATISNAAAPFGGVKLSGLGREGGSEGIDEYLETQYIGLPA